MLKGLIYIAITIILLLGYVKYIEMRGIFFPTKEISFTPQLINLAFEDVIIETADKLKINGWFIPHLQQGRISLGQEGAGFIPHTDAKYTILFCHGNAGNLGDRIDKIDLLNKIGINLFIIDYRGFGISQGRPSEEGIYMDVKAAYDYLVDKRKIKPEEIILYGESIGAAMAINLASRVKIKALILEGAFSKGRDMARRVYPFLPTFLFSNGLDSLAKIKEIEAPKLFIHSQNDEIVPLDLAKKLYHAAKEPKQFTEILGGHNTAFLDSQEKYVSSIASFIKQL